MATKPDFHEWRPHPWHGLEAGRELVCVNAYIEIGAEHAAQVVEASVADYQALLSGR